MKYFLLLPFLISLSCSSEKDAIYSTSDTLWAEDLGNHRAVLQVDRELDAVFLDIIWRRHDKNPETKKFIIVHESSGDTITNIHRVHVDNERCQLVFGPVSRAGTYHFYYLPYSPWEGWGLFVNDYLKKEELPDKAWLLSNQLADISKVEELPEARLVRFESRTEFDNFYPMEIIALGTEKEKLLSNSNGEFLIFPESRNFPIRMKDDIPLKWIQSGPSNNFEGKAQKNEYFTFQFGIYASQKNLEDVKVVFSALRNGEREIPASSLTCFNTGGIGPYGKPFIKRVDVAKGNIQALWIGADIPMDIPAGNYKGTVTITPKNASRQDVELSIRIEDKILTDRGDNEPWRHSRLRWLNSTLGIDDNPTSTYEPIKISGNNTYKLTNKEVKIAENGFPASIMVGKTEILEHPVSFIVETVNGRQGFSASENVQILKSEAGLVSSSWEANSQDLELKGFFSIESDGYINYKIMLKAVKDVNLKDIKLEIPIQNNVAKYMMGMGLPGTSVPKKHHAKWEGPHDSFWIGNTHAGLWCELRSDDYHGPLLNVFKPPYPKSWYNNNSGGFKIQKGKQDIRAIVYSGDRDLKTGEEIEFEWSMLITPVKEVNYQDQFLNRYYHGQDPIMPTDKDLETGVKIVNLHHANNYNPYINYPFIAVDSMKWFIDELHNKNQKVKIYYTIRELSNHTTEIWALRSLGDEILGNGEGGGYFWLREHLVEGYRHQWYQYLSEKSADAAIINAPGESRWYNYYIEGLAWLVKNVDIDGLYLDEVSYDRRTVKRIRKVLDREKPGCLIDLHANTGFSIGPATQYTEFFPYIDKLWFGEFFYYDKMPPENWLVEVSGIPFGLTGDMLHAGGNPWLGMLFGMTVRYPWQTEGVTCDPRPVWKIWDEFEIHNARVIGFWENDPPVRSNTADVLVTTYVKDGMSLIAVGNFSDDIKTTSLHIDFEKLGLIAKNVNLVSPAIEDFQPEKHWKIDDKITIEPRRSWLIIVR